jgi:hypothetical protein
MPFLPATDGLAILRRARWGEGGTQQPEWNCNANITRRNADARGFFQFFPSRRIGAKALDRGGLGFDHVSSSRKYNRLLGGNVIRSLCTGPKQYHQLARIGVCGHGM